MLVSDPAATGLAVGDVNHDGLNDFALDGALTTSAPVYVQSALDHSFTKVDVALPSAVTGATLVDIDDDTNADLLTVTDANALAWSLADGSGGFGAFTSIAGTAFAAKQVGDLNDDGRSDLATFSANGTLRIYLQKDTGGLGAPCSFPAAADPGGDPAVSAGDATGDGADDLADADTTGGSGGAWLFRQLTGGELLLTAVDATLSTDHRRVGKRVTITGAFANPGGGCLREHTVSLWRTAPGGSPVARDTKTIRSDGSFTFRDTPKRAGTYRYEVRFDGDATHEASDSGNLLFDATRIPTSVDLKLTRPIITYGDRTVLVTHLRGAAQDSVIAFQKVAGGSWHTIDTVHVDADGDARLPLTPPRETKFRAVYAATTNRTGSASAPRTVQVHAVMVSKMIGNGVKDGRYTVYPCCSAYFYVKVKPLHPKAAWVATVQYYGGGKWRPLGSGTYHLESDGDAAIFLNAVKGFHYRVRGHFDGDADHLAATSAWNYFRYR
jgi:hypothetical protein